MVHDRTWPSRMFDGLNYSFLTLLSLLCVVPLVHVLAVSFSSPTAADGGMVGLWPVDFSTDAYRYVLNKPEFFRSIGVTLQKVLLGTAINLILVILLAYPLSKEAQVFPMRTFYAWLVAFTMLFGGGLIPTYMVVRETNIMNTIWALVLPGAVPVFHVLMLLNFFRGIPKEMEEAAMIDGAGHGTILWKIMLPLSVPALATLLVFNMVGHWNAWFDGMIYMNSPTNYPLQTYLRTIVIDLDFTVLTMDAIDQMESLSPRTTRAAQIFLGCLPIIAVYPFLQRFFMKGIVLGSVKG